MNCKFCNAELEEQSMICPACGKDNTAEETELLTGEETVAEAVEQTEETVCEETAEEIVEEATAEETAEETKEAEEIPEAAPQAEEVQLDLQQPKSKKNAWVIAVAIVCSALILAGSVLLGLWMFNKGIFTKRENNANYKDSYIAEGRKLDKAMDDVIATMGDIELTNGEFQIYYWMQVYNVLEYYGSNIDVDLSKPLAEQNITDDMSWEQYLLDLALATWNRYQSLCLAAEKEGFALPAEVQEVLDSTVENLEAAAKEYEFASAEEMIQADMGPGCTLEDYLKYMKDYYLGVYYFNNIVEQMNPTEDEVSAFFDEKAEDFESQYGVTKESGKLVDIRHILIAPEGAETDESGYPVATDEQWEACRAQAQALLDEWKAGEATEESFAALAAEHSIDTGSSSNGGLYSAVPTGYMVENFDAWMFDESRSSGDTGLVKTEFGYHIMYYVSGEEGWLLYGTEALINELSSQRLDEITKANPMEVTYKNIVLGQADLASNTAQ